MGAVGVTPHCLGPEALLALAEGDEDDVDRRHLGGCAACRAALAAVIRAVRSDLALDDRVVTTGTKPLPEKLGRYRIVRRIGAGAMGEVFEAFDPELARPVAIKQLRDASGRGRLRAAIREARSLARLADPHVVAVLEAGDDWIAMELVDGPTLAQWQRGQPWRRVLDVYLQAASGLAAAHRTGVVHRDFKPHNVLVEDRGGVRAKVVDFGLAAPGGDADATGGDELATTDGTGLRGTPAYMAPEQFAGQVADAASDQFAFCIALWEALAGVRPFAGNDLASLSAAVLGNRRRPRPRGPVPSGVWQALERGLRPDRRARFAAMDELTAALRRGARPRRAAWIAAPLLVAAAIAVVGERNEGCADLPPIDAVWNAARASALQRALLDQPVSYASTTAATVLDRAERYAGAWMQQRAAACASPTVAPAVRACLEDRRGAFDALVQRMTDEPRLAPIAARVIQQLAPVTSCEGAREVAARSPAAAELTRELAEVRHGLLGESKPDAAPTEELAARAEALGDRDVIAEAQALLGTLYGRRGEWDRAMPVLEQAHALAVESGSDALIAETALHLGMGEVWRGRPEEALSWLGVAEGHAIDPAQRDNTISARVEALLALGRAAEAETTLEAFLAAAPPGFARTLALTDRAQLYAFARDFDRAEASVREAIAFLEAEAGVGHPDLARPLSLLGTVQIQRGALPEAIATLSQALALAERDGGPDHPHVSYVMGNLALAYGEAGDPERAWRTLLVVADRLARGASPDHPRAAITYANLARWADDAGHHEQALAHARDAIAMRERLGSGDADLSALHTMIAIRKRQGDRAGVLADAERLIALRTARQPEDRDALGWAELTAAEACDDPAAAAAHLEQAFAHYAASPSVSSGEHGRAWLVAAGVRRSDPDAARDALLRAWPLLARVDADLGRSVRDSHVRLRWAVQWAALGERGATADHVR